MKKQVVCVWGNPFTNDFVLEQPCSDACNCEVCKDNLYWITIEKVEKKK